MTTTNYHMDKPQNDHGLYFEIHNLDNMKYLLEQEVGLEFVGKEEPSRDCAGGALHYKHPESRNNVSAKLFLDTAMVYVYTNKIDGLTMDTTFDVGNVIEYNLKRDPKEYSIEREWWAPKNKSRSSKNGISKYKGFDWSSIKKLTEIKTMSQVMTDMRSVPDEEKVFSHFIVKGSIMVLYAPPEAGKSGMLIQIARKITMGEAMEPFTKSGKPYGVLYLNYEQSQRQMVGRYRQDGLEMEFNERFQIICKDTLGDLFTVNKVAEQVIKAKQNDPGLGVVIIDNLSYLIAYSKELGDVATFLKPLGFIASELDIAIVLVNHVPKGIEDKKLSQDNMQGSKAYSNYTENVIEMRKGKNPGEVFLGEVKSRNAQKVFTGDNLPLFKMSKDPFLEFKFDRFTSENDQITGKSTGLDGKTLKAGFRMETSKRMRDKNYKIKDIADCLDITVQQVHRYLKDYMPEPK